ncbi:MAG: disulfide bond formation protein DsbA [Deltaproteobacteria bacterium]|nr:disulfide bond formation protein DsbA [Deltaproteobacteria bacterium]
METVRITHDELVAQFHDRVSIDYRYVQVFGSVRAKMTAQWSERGGIQGYAEHVREIASGFEHVSIHPEVWLKTTPESSMPSHLFLCAVRELEIRGDADLGSQARAAWAVREAFFRECADIAVRSVLLEVGERAGVPAARVEPLLDGGIAHAALSADLGEVRDHTVRASPTLMLDEDRQRLTGNVGYRVIEANVRELLEKPTGQQSWC